MSIEAAHCCDSLEPDVAAQVSATFENFWRALPPAPCPECGIDTPIWWHGDSDTTLSFHAALCDDCYEREMENDDELECVTVLPAEYFGFAAVIEGALDIGGVQVPLPDSEGMPVFVRRDSRDLSVAEIVMARHDGYAQEELEAQNDEAERYPLGPKEYWRTEMVGKYVLATDDESHLMTDEEFESYWEETSA